MNTRRAAVLGVIIGEHHSLASKTVNVRCFVANHATRIRANIGLADIVAKNNENVWTLRCGRLSTTLLHSRKGNEKAQRQ
jgi:hypothetical protein